MSGISASILICYHSSIDAINLKGSAYQVSPVILQTSLATNQFQVYSSPGHNNVCQREGKVHSGYVRQVEVVLSTSVFHNHQCLQFINVGHYVALCMVGVEKDG